MASKHENSSLIKDVQIKARMNKVFVAPVAKDAIAAKTAGGAKMADKKDASSLPTLRCLVVDDSASVRKILRHMLTKRMDHTAVEVSE